MMADDMIATKGFIHQIKSFFQCSVQSELGRISPHMGSISPSLSSSKSPKWMFTPWYFNHLVARSCARSRFLFLITSSLHLITIFPKNVEGITNWYTFNLNTKLTNKVIDRNIIINVIEDNFTNLRKLH